MTTDTITPEQRLTVVKHLASGKGLDVVASLARLSRDQVLDIGSSHGYPKVDSLKRAVEILTKKLDEDRSAALPTTTAPTAVGRRPVQPAQTPAEAAPAGRPDEFRVLINTAKGMPSKRIQALANRILDDTAKLRGLIQDEADKVAKKREAEQARVAARAEVERLERQLAAAKAKLRGAPVKEKKEASSSSTVGAEPTAADVRSWAIEQGIDCPTRGVLPTRIREAYDEAHQAGDAA